MARNGDKETPAAQNKGQVKKIKLSIALQGGGAHGAFAWGVLDRLLEDGRFEIEGISGTSAGAMNGAALASGLLTGGNEGARDSLRKLWTRVGARHALSPFATPFWARLLGDHNLDNNPVFMAYEMLRRWVTPVQMNPGNYHPLRAILEDVIDFEAIQKADPNGVELFVNAVDVQAGSLKTFKNVEITADALLASGALPDIFNAVEIDGRHYWDGGFMANPDLEPLIDDCQASDILVIQINAIHRNKVPSTPIEILDRQNEITMNANLLSQVRQIQRTNREIEQGILQPGGKYRKVNLHRVEAAKALEKYNVTSKMNTDPIFLKELFELGRKAADAWLLEKAAKVGVESTFTLDGRHVAGEKIDPALPQAKGSIHDPSSPSYVGDDDPFANSRFFRRPLRENTRRGNKPPAAGGSAPPPPPSNKPTGPR
jgi:NTE family protein